MRQNKYTGALQFPVEGHGDVRLRFDWDAIAELHSRLGKQWEAEIGRIVTELDARSLADVLAIGSDHPAEWWIEQSPPFIPVAQAVQEALHLAFFGPGGPDERPTMARRLTTLLSRLGKSGSNSAGGQAISGA